MLFELQQFKIIGGDVDEEEGVTVPFALATAATAAVINGLFVGFKLKLDARTLDSNFTAAGLQIGFNRLFVAVDPFRLFGSI